MSFVWEGNTVDNLIKTVEDAEKANRETQLQQASREAAIEIGEYFLASVSKRTFTTSGVAAIIYKHMRRIEQ